MWHVLSVAALLLTPASLSGAASQWLRISTPNFELLTDAGEKKGLTAIARLEEIRSVFGFSAPAPRVFVLASEADRKMFDLHEFKPGSFLGTPERNYILLRDVDERIVYHEYTHFVFARTHGPLPAWFAEGAAEFYSALGRPIPGHIARLNAEGWLPMDTWLAGGGGSAQFYAQSWAFIHMLYTSRSYRDHPPGLMKRLEEGAPAARAFADAFGKPLADALGEARLMAGRSSITLTIKGPLPAPQIEALPDPTATIALADLSLDLNRYDHAFKIYSELARNRPQDPAAATGLGALALRRGDYAEARRLLRRAIELGSREARTHYEYAMLVRESKGPPAEVIESLRRAVELAPDFADAKYLLELAELGRKQRETATAVRASKPQVTVPKSWNNPEGDARLDAVLEQVDCLGAQARLWVSANGKRYGLAVREQGKIPIRNSGGVTFEFKCGRQEPRRLGIEYLAKPDALAGTIGDVTALEFH